MTIRKAFVLIVPPVIAIALAAQASGQAAPSNVRVEFGKEVGSPFPPPSGHDHSGRASHKMFPRTVTIARGGSVTFEIDPVHQPAIYGPGTEPAGIRVAAEVLDDLSLPCIPQTLADFVINDTANRIALGPPATCDEKAWTTPAGTFDQPGRYLVICTTRPHFVEDKMYGWVIVR